MAAKKSLLTIFKMYGQYVQQKGRSMADAYLAQEGITGDYARAIHDSFSDAGKLVDENGRTPGLMDLMGMKSFI